MMDPTDGWQDAEVNMATVEEMLADSGLTVEPADDHTSQAVDNACPPEAGEMMPFIQQLQDFQPSFLQFNSEATIDSDRSHYVYTDDMDNAVDALDTHGRVDPLDVELKREMLTVHLNELHLDTAEQDALVTKILQKDVSGAAFPWFLLQHVLMKKTATQLSVTIGPSPDDRQLLMQTIYEHIKGSLAFRLLTDVEVDEKDEEGNTLLHVAASVGDMDAVTVAVKSGDFAIVPFRRT
nr:hypothetical protein BaRGS_027461 [Batillaria attramentaria]